MVRGMMNLVHFSNCCCCFWKELKVMFNEAQGCNVFFWSRIWISFNFWKSFYTLILGQFCNHSCDFFAKLQRCYRDLLKIFGYIVQSWREVWPKTRGPPATVDNYLLWHENSIMRRVILRGVSLNFGAKLFRTIIISKTGLYLCTLGKNIRNYPKT